ncbi:MAG: ribose-phosphate diphosphokinase [bacterium]
MLSNTLLISGTSNRNLSEGISRYLGIPLLDVDIVRFKDGETFCQINENVRGRNAFIIQATSPPANDNLMELLIIIDCLKRSSAETINVVTPYFGYARQDRKLKPRVPITAKLVANLLTVAGTNRLLTIDLHAGQIQGFFDIPVDNLFATPVLLEYIRQKQFKEVVIVSPDAGGVERARAFSSKLDNSGLAIIDKRRLRANVAEAMNVIGEVEGKSAIIVDDIIDTAGTMCESVNAILKAGAKEVYACCSHGILSDPALERIGKSPLKELIITDTIPLSEEGEKSEKITVLAVSSLIGEAIRRICENNSVSSLFV